VATRSESEDRAMRGPNLAPFLSEGGRSFKSARAGSTPVGVTKYYAS
jgi:hypothetical protein